MLISDKALGDGKYSQIQIELKRIFPSESITMIWTRGFNEKAWEGGCII